LNDQPSQLHLSTNCRGSACKIPRSLFYWRWKSWRNAAMWRRSNCRYMKVVCRKWNSSSNAANSDWLSLRRAEKWRVRIWRTNGLFGAFYSVQCESAIKRRHVWTVFH